MRIGIDMRMASEENGIGRYGLELVRKILALDSENTYTLFVRDLAKFKSYKDFDKAELVLADIPHYSLDEQTKFNDLISKYNFDLFHFLNFNVPIFYRKPFVVTIHDLIHHKMPGTKKGRLLHRLAYRLIMRHAVFNSKGIVTVSNYSKRDIAETFSVDPKKIAMIYEAANPVPITDSDVNQVLQKFALNKSYVVFVGVMERKKNIINLTHAFDILKEQFGLNIQMVLAGKADSHYPEVIEEAARIKYRKDLIITGVVTDKEKYALYKGAQAFVSASLFEGFGLPGVEAMSLGVPLIVSNTEVFNEIYDNGAIYFDPNNPEDIAQKINLLLSDKKYREMVANNAYLRAQYFSWEKCAEETVKFYKKVV